MRITKKKLEFPKELKDKCNRYLSRKTLEITYFDGYMVKFAGTNVSTISPHKILLKSKEKEVVILYYGEHLYDEELFFINNTKNGCSFQKLRELVVNYF